MTWANGRAGVRRWDGITSPEGPASSGAQLGPIATPDDRDRCLEALAWLQTGRHTNVVR